MPHDVTTHTTYAGPQYTWTCSCGLKHGPFGSWRAAAASAARHALGPCGTDGCLNAATVAPDGVCGRCAVAQTRGVAA